MFKWISGCVTLELTSADVAGTVRRITEMGIETRSVCFVSELTIHITVSRRDWARVSDYAEKRGITLRILNQEGLYWKLTAMAKRPVLMGGMVLFLLLCALAPERILFVEVEGNERVPSRLILEAAGESGIGFGADRRDVRSEKMKNTLLAKIPELQWAGVNTYGCRAVITVRERSPEESEENQPGVSCIVADRDGVVLSCTATGGSLMVAPGQTVRKGQVLISGYSDHGLSVTATRAEGEIMALTRRPLTVKTPAFQQLRRSESGKTEKYSLLIGKKRINFYKGSGISGAGCVKMYSKYVLTLPGGFELPVSLLKETVIPCDLQDSERGEEDVSRALSRFGEDYLRSRMIAGVILDRETNFYREDGYCLAGQYACQEMIGRERPEQIGVYHGKTD